MGLVVVLAVIIGFCAFDLYEALFRDDASDDPPSDTRSWRIRGAGWSAVHG